MFLNYIAFDGGIIIFVTMFLMISGWYAETEVLNMAEDISFSKMIKMIEEEEVVGETVIGCGVY